MTRYLNLKPWEVRAILDGRKTRVRRVLKVQPPPCYYLGMSCGQNFFSGYNVAGDEVFRVNLPFSPGDVLLCRETFALEDTRDYEGEPGIETPEGPVQWVDDFSWHRLIPRYKATAPDTLLEITGEGEDGMRWSSPILMPSWAVRIKLRVKAVRVERVQEISEEEARAEGIRFFDFGVVADPNFADGRPVKGWSWKHDAGPGDLLATERLGYANAYITDHGPGSWERNEWVAVGEIELVSDRKEKEEGG